MITKTPIQWFEEANDNFLQGAYKKAVLHYDYSITVGWKENGCVWFNHGNALLALGKLDDALESYNAALLYLPEDSDILNNKGSLLSQKGDYKSANDCFQEAIKNNKMYIPAYINVANNYYMMKEFALAEKYYRMAAEREPTEINAYLGLAKVFIVEGSYKDALKELENALQINPKNHVALRTKGTALLYLEGQFDEAITSIDQSLEIEPEDLDSLLWKSQALYLKGKQKEAKRIYKTCQEKNTEKTKSWAKENTAPRSIILFTKNGKKPPSYY